MRLFLATLFIALCLLVVGLQFSCSKKGGEGAACQEPKDCKYGFRCENSRCIGGAESACGYLRRCFPKLSLDNKETIFGASYTQFGEWIQTATDADEPGCQRQLNLIVQMNRLVVLNRACGPQVQK